MNLRRGLTTFVLVSAVFLLAGESARAQGARTSAVYNPPAELKLQRTARRDFRGYHREYPGQQFYVENFYPIGWSRGGNFAFYAEPVDEACDCYFARLLILDLRTDRVLWSFEYNGDSHEEDRKAGKPYSFATMWRANRKLFNDKLREFGIEPGGRFSLLSFPARSGGDIVTADFKTQRKPGLDEDARLYGVVGRTTLRLNSRRKGSKTVLDHAYKEGDALPLYVGLAGYAKSPFEQRAAVILIEIYRGYEGPPNTGTVKIVGAGLGTGFK
jgi:hypothetical protein